MKGVVSNEIFWETLYLYPAHKSILGRGASIRNGRSYKLCEKMATIFIPK